MVKSKIQKVSTLALAGVLSVGMLVGSFGAQQVQAAGPSPTPDTQSQTIQANSSNVATVTLGKTLTVNQNNKFPLVTDYNYTIERIKAWDNANEDTTKNGTVIAKANMPMPATSNTANHTVTVNGDTATVAVGNFSGEATTNVADTATQKFRTTPVNIAFTKAGYYVYKVKEISSTPANIKGADYDTHEYFMVFYVCNKVDANGNTVGASTADGVYVHDITSYRNESGSETYQPNLSDIQNVTDHNNAPAKENNGSSKADGTVDGNLDKVGKSTPTPGTDPRTGIETGPNKLEAYKMWNMQTTHDVVLKKNVTGNLGDKTKKFLYTVTLTGLEPGQTYTTNVAAEYTNDVSTVTIEDMDNTGTLNAQKNAFTASNTGEAVFKVRLKDDDIFVINALPMTATYKFKEAESNHVASYAITSSNDDATNAPVFAKASNQNTASDTALETSQETVDRYDDTVTVTYSNNRDLATITGIPSMLIYFAAAGLFALLAFVAIRRRKDDTLTEEM